MLVRDTSNAIGKLTQLATNSNQKLHFKCRSSDSNSISKYLTGREESEVARPVIPDDKVEWKVDWKDYDKVLVRYTAPVVKKNPVWADPQEPDPKTKWNDLDGKIDRRSHIGVYEIKRPENIPMNPMGRTGICERGLLGKWGPNHAADPIVTRWKTDKNGEKVVHSDGKPILQFVSIRRVDTGEWAIPGGMCDPGEKISQTLRREFMEEALNSEEMSPQEVQHYKNLLEDFFSKGIEIYRGYVDDPRNTDNAWMETIAVHFHDKDGSVFKNIKLKAGDDAKHVRWMDIDGTTLKLYASHQEFVKEVVKRLGAHW